MNHGGCVLQVLSFVIKLKKKAAAKSKHIPSPLQACQVIAAGVRIGDQAGYAAERKAIRELANSDVSKQLLRLFFLKQHAKSHLKKKLT